MKKVLLIFLSALAIASCNLTDPDVNFFDLEDILRHSEELSVSDTVFHSAADGYGWKWVSTNEILEDGSLSPKPIYDDLDGAGPSHYYFEATSFTTFCYVNDISGLCFFNRSYDFEQSSVWSYNMAGRFHKMKVLTIDKSKMVCVEWLGYGNSNREIYGLSVYSRMTEKELLKVRSEYSTFILVD